MRNNIRKKYLGFVFQSSNLLNEFNAIENVALSRIIKGYNFPDALDYAKKLLKPYEIKQLAYILRSDLTISKTSNFEAPGPET